MSCKVTTLVYRKPYLKWEVMMRIVNVVLVFACAAFAGCVQTAHLSKALSGGGVERVAGSYHMELVGDDWFAPTARRPIGRVMRYG